MGISRNADQSGQAWTILSPGRLLEWDWWGQGVPAGEGASLGLSLQPQWEQEPDLCLEEPPDDSAEASLSRLGNQGHLRVFMCSGWP